MGKPPDFVQKQRTAMGQLKAPKTVGYGTREAAFAVTKQLAFNQLTRYSATVDGHKRRAGARALGMQGLGHQFFARPTFTSDQSGRG